MSRSNDDSPSFLDQIKQRARERRLKVVLPEGDDPRILAAAHRLQTEGLAEAIVLGEAGAVAESARKAGVDASRITVIEPASGSGKLEQYVDAYVQRRGLQVNVARRMLRKPLIFGGMMVACEDADTMVAGVSSATANVIQAGAVTVGLAPGFETVSSFFLMVFPGAAGKPARNLVMADCAVTIQPTPAQLADIALASLASASRLLSEPARVALLSFSTRGSAAHELVDRVTEALRIVHQRDPAALVDGEFQLDTALVPEIAAKKLREPSPVAGQANVLIFPDLNAANIGYKLAQHLAGAQAIGPFLQGFAKPLSDLSRGASVDEIVATTAILSAMA